MLGLVAAAAVLAATPRCPQGWEAVPGQGCLLRGGRPGVVVYLHGLAPHPFAIASEWKLLAEAPRHRRQSVLALWGTRGLCEWAPDAYCWPADRSQLAELEKLKKRLQVALEGVRARLGRRAGAVVVSGYSNGAYCVSMLMAEGALPASGWALLQGGPVTGNAYARERERPTWLLAAAEDPIQGPAMVALKGQLEGAGWHPRLTVRPGQHPPAPGDYLGLFDFAAGAAGAAGAR